MLWSAAEDQAATRFDNTDYVLQRSHADDLPQNASAETIEPAASRLVSHV